jgi:hypothetical protein
MMSQLPLVVRVAAGAVVSTAGLPAARLGLTGAPSQRFNARVTGARLERQHQADHQAQGHRHGQLGGNPRPASSSHEA